MNPNETTMYEEKYFITEFRVYSELEDYLRNQNYTEANNAFESNRIIEEYDV